MNAEERDYELCARANKEYTENPKAKDGIKFECFNSIEANMLKIIMEEKYPHVKAYYTWMFTCK